MPLQREDILRVALAILHRHGLADLSMRRIASELDVRPGALYWHIKNKQELLIAVAGRIVDAVPAPDPGSGWAERARATATATREALLAYRDGAEIVTLAASATPTPLRPAHIFRTVFDTIDIGPRQSQWAANTMLHYILGFVSDEQSYRQMLEAGALAPAADEHDYDRQFSFGIGLLLTGIERNRTQS